MYVQEVAQLQRELARTAADAAAIYRGAMNREMLGRERSLRSELQVRASYKLGQCSSVIWEHNDSFRVSYA